MILYYNLGFYGRLSTMGSIAEQIPNQSGFPGYVWLVNDSDWYEGLYYGPSNSAPGWVWTLSYSGMKPDVRGEDTLSGEGGYIDIMGLYGKAGNLAFYFCCAYIGYAYHIGEGKFLYLGDFKEPEWQPVNPGPYPNRAPGDKISSVEGEGLEMSPEDLAIARKALRPGHDRWILADPDYFERQAQAAHEKWLAEQAAEEAARVAAERAAQREEAKAATAERRRLQKEAEEAAKAAAAEAKAKAEAEAEAARIAAERAAQRERAREAAAERAREAAEAAAKAKAEAEAKAKAEAEAEARRQQREEAREAQAAREREEAIAERRREIREQGYAQSAADSEDEDPRPEDFGI